MSAPAPDGPLAGLRVVDLTAQLAGPYCTMILGDLGADVIKIERPGRGDDARSFPPHVGGEGAPFMAVNRNKRSVVLDLKDPGDLAVCADLAAGADILVENFRPGVVDRLGLGYDALSARNPRLIYCSISGFGQTGPWRDRGGFDLMAQAMSGLMSVCGPEDGPPHRLPPPVSDIGAGMYGAIGVLAALAARARTGRGQRVDACLYDTAVAFGHYEAIGFLATGTPPERLGQGHRGAAPYQVFRTADGWVTLGSATQSLWEKLCRLLGRDDLAADPRFADNAGRVANRAALVTALEDALAARTTDDWVAALDAAGIPVGPVRTYDEVLTGPQVAARRMVETVDHPAAGTTRMLGIPVKLSETPGSIRRPAPRLGEHTAAVLAECAARDGPTSR